MNKSQIMRYVMRDTWAIIKTDGLTFGEALKCSWSNLRLLELLSNGYASFKYIKANGELREAFGTLKSANVSTSRRCSILIQPYYDLDKRAWRCFRKTRLIYK